MGPVNEQNCIQKQRDHDLTMIAVLNKEIHEPINSTS